MNRCRRAAWIALAAVGLTFVGAPASGASQATAPVLAGSPAGASLQRLVERVVEAGAPGASLLVRDGSTTRTFTSGVADTETARALRGEDHYRTGSVTKTLVSTLVLQLVGRGDLELDDPIADYLPRLIPDGEHITVRQLLNHTSGLFDFTGDRKFLRRLTRGEAFRPRELVSYSTRHDVLFPPGTDWSYSNANYVVIGLLVRKIGGDTVRAQMADRILEPLGLADTSFPVRRKELGGSYSHGYLGEQSGALLDVTSYFSPSWAWTAGALVSNTADLAALYRGLLSGDLLEPAELEEMKDTVPIGGGAAYGLGLLTVDLPCGTAFGHDGIYIGYYNFALSTEDGARQAVVMMNVDPVNGFPPPDAFPAAIDALIAGFCGGGVPSGSPLVGLTPELAGQPYAREVPTVFGE